jgi:hypothetical protein
MNGAVVVAFMARGSRNLLEIFKGFVIVNGLKIVC